MAQLSDIRGHWAEEFITALSDRQIISGFPDGTFQPDRALTRAQFAALLRSAFDRPRVRNAITFRDVPSRHWAASAIREAYETAFISGYPNNYFRPDWNITRVQLWVALINGLDLGDRDLSASELQGLYQDASDIPDYGINQVAAATAQNMVVNYPRLDRLEPNRPATRGEVAAILYQALVKTNRYPSIDSPYVLDVEEPAPQVVNVSHTRELRGAWIASVWNLNWPSKQGMTGTAQKLELTTILDRLASLKFNAVFLQVRPEGDAFYKSNLEPWSRWLTGTQGRPPSPYYDPLEFAIAECRKRNMELHAWFNPFRARSSTNAPKGVAPHIEATMPDAVHTYGTQRWMDPGLRTVRDRTYEVIMDVVKRYDIDGVHLDDYFYPYPVADTDFPDRGTYYAWGGGRTIEDWRRHNVNRMVEQLAKGIRNLKPHVAFGISPFGIYQSGVPTGIKGLSQYDALFADPKYWVQQGWVDYIAPQLYWRIDQTGQSYRTLLDWWSSLSRKNGQGKIPVIAGNNLVKLGSSGWSVAEFEKQIGLSRDRNRNENSVGNIFYNTDPIMENRAGFGARLGRNIYNTLALPPVLNPTSVDPLDPPKVTSESGGQVQWDGQFGVRHWTVYKQVGNSWDLVKILPPDARSIGLSAGRYAICAVDRFARESQGIVVTP
ncbi:MAG: family 10 glycosylhydrolase [Cyanophyceae cyanobacterium]